MRIRKTSETAPIQAQVVDNLNTDSPTDALSAKQGKILKEIIEGTVLYENSNGGNPANEITLNDEVENYSRIKVFYGKSKNQGLNSVETEISISKYLSCISYILISSTQAQLLTSKMYANGNSLTQIDSHYLNISTSHSEVGTSTEMRIFKVIGYKY